MIGPHWVTRKKRLRDYANAHGIPVPAGFRISPTCGKYCRELIRRIEVRTWGPAAGTGKWDGRLNDLIAPKLTLGQKMLKKAQGEVGVKEHPPGTNRGPRVDQYTATTGTQGLAWCAAFQNWCRAQVTGHGFQGINAAYVPSYVAAARAGRNGLSLVAARAVKPGDLVCFDWEHDGTADHIGIVEKAPGTGSTFVSIEGNTAVGNDSNGGQVMRRNRDTSQVAAFIRVA